MKPNKYEIEKALHKILSENSEAEGVDYLYRRGIFTVDDALHQIARIYREEIDKKKASEEQKGHWYYSIHRPVSIGTYPKDGMIGFTNYDRREEKKLPDGRTIRVWGEIAYSRKLTEKELNDYEFVEI